MVGRSTWQIAAAFWLASSSTGVADLVVYDEGNAVDLAFLCTASYCNKASVESWSCGSPCIAGAEDEHAIRNVTTDAHGFIAHFNGECMLVFRGSSSVENWETDFNSQKLVPIPSLFLDGWGSKVGSGFLESYMSLRDQARNQLASIGCDHSAPLTIIGHSLGGALATLASLDFARDGYTVSKVYTFGSPRVGNWAFSQAAHQQVYSSVPYYRLTRADDPVVYMPEQRMSAEKFYHTGTEIYYEGGTDQGYKVCNGAVPEDASCASKNGEWRVHGLISRCSIIYQCGHVLYLHPRKSGLMYGPIECSSSVELVQV